MAAFNHSDGPYRASQLTKIGLLVILWITVVAPGISIAQMVGPTVTVVSPYSGQVNLLWTPNPTATTYQVSRALLDMTNTPTPSVVSYIPSSAFNIPPGTPVFTDYQVTDGRTYQYSVAGIDSLGNLGMSAPVTVVPYTAAGTVNATVQNLHANSLDLSWNEPLSTFPVSFYNVYRESSSSAVTGSVIPVATFFAPSPVPIATAVTTSFSDQTASALVGATAIFYMVVAVDSQPVTGLYPSASTTGALPESSLPPAAPILSGYIPVVQTGTTTPTTTPVYGVQLYWTGPLAVEGVTNYQVLANSTPIATIQVSPTPSPTYSYFDTTILPSSVSSGTTYSIVAVNTVGTVTSNAIQESIIPPSINTIPLVTPNATSNSVTVSWLPGAGGTYGLQGYSIYRGLSGVPIPYYGSPTATITNTATPTPLINVIETPSRTPTVFATVAIANDPDSYPGSYTYWVQPFNILGGAQTILNGNPSAVTLVLAPTPVTNITANQVPNTNNQVNISWSGASPGFYGSIQNYAVYRSENGGTPTIVATVSANRSSRNNYVMPNAGITTATYFVGAVDAFGNVSDLSVMSSSLSLATTLSAPQIPRVIHSDQSATQLTFNWLLNPASDNVTSYSVYGSDYYTVTATTSNTPSPIANIQITVTPTPFSTGVPALWSSSTYYLVANNAQGSSQPATLSAIAVPTYQVTAVTTAPTQVMVSWNVTPASDATPNVDSWAIYRMAATPTPGSFQPIAIIPVATMSYLDSGVVPGVNYSYWVTARSDLAGTPLAESPISVTGGSPATVLTWPNVPTVTSITTGSSATTLSWNVNPTVESVSSYIIYHNGSPVATVVPLPVMTAITAVFVETPGVISSYQIVANNMGGPSNSPVTQVLPVPSQTMVVNLTPPVAANYTPVVGAQTPVWISGLTYPLGGSIQNYTIYRATDSGFLTGTPVATVSAPTSFVSDSGQTGSINYYKAVANNGAGVTANFTLSGLVGVTLWPNQPSNMTANAGTNAVTMNWAAPVSGTSPVTAYDVYRGLAPGAETPYATAIPQRSGPYVDAAVTPGIPYFYYMDSIAGGLNSAPTSEQGAIPGPAPILSGVAGVGQGILTWSPVAVPTSSPVTAYVVYKLAMATPAGPAITPSSFVVPSLTTTTYTDSAVTYAQGYIYKVAPMAFATTDVSIIGNYSNSVTLTVPPQGPSSVIAVSGDQLAQLRWNYQGSAVTYTYSIQRKLGTAPVTAYQTIATGITGLDYTDTGLLDKTLYNYEIVSVDPSGLTATSLPVNALPAKPPVVDNPNLVLNQTQSGNVINWIAANSSSGDFNSATMYPLGGYHVYRSSDGGGTYQLLDASGDTLTSYTDDVQIINGTNYTYLVHAYDAPPNVNTSDPNMVHESTYNSIAAPSLSASTALDRNSIRPFGTNAGDSPVVHIRFVVTTPGNVQIKVYSLSGIFIKQLVNQYFGVGVFGGVGDPYVLQWDGRNASGNLVASGVYLITTEMNGLQEIDKIAVIK